MLRLAWSWKCNHDDFQRSLTVIRAPEVAHAARLGTVERHNIRIKFDTTYIDTANPQGLETCQNANDQITWGGETFTCTNDDLWTEEKRDVIKGTFANIETFFESILKVDPVSGILDLVRGEGLPLPGEQSSDTDLYVVLYPRPFGEGSGTLASAGYTKMDSNGRPTQGVVNLNLAQLPKKVQNVSTEGDRGFFETAVHEMCHVLGISGNAFLTWRKSDGSAYKESEILYTREVAGKTMTILHTPRLHWLMTERLGVEYFDGNTEWPVGVEIEDAGGTGTTGSHWEERVFFTELMVGTTFGYARISEVTLCALEDTGWYDVDHSVAEPLEWGDYLSIRGATREQFKDFASGKPVKVWPDHYVAKTTPTDGSSMCTFDHRAVGYVTYEKRNCNGRNDGECQYPDFYDPEKTGNYGSPIMDYNLVTLPYSNRICSFEDTSYVGTAPGTYFGPNSMCARTTLGLQNPAYSCFRMGCDENGTLSIGVGEETKQCTKEGDQLRFEKTHSWGYVECPNPDIVCGILAYNGTVSPMPDFTGPHSEPGGQPGGEPGNPNPGKTNEDDSSDWPLGLSKYVWIAIGVGVCVFVVALVLGVCLCGRSSKKHKKPKHKKRVKA